MKIKNPPKSIFQQIFCKHNWKDMGMQSMYQSIREQEAKLPFEVYIRWYCTKCGKIKRQRTL